MSSSPEQADNLPFAPSRASPITDLINATEEDEGQSCYQLDTVVKLLMAAMAVIGIVSLLVLLTYSSFTVTLFILIGILLLSMWQRRRTIRRLAFQLWRSEYEEDWDLENQDSDGEEEVDEETDMR